jgi:hypothetical protein
MGSGTFRSVGVGTSSRTVRRGPCAGPAFHLCPHGAGVVRRLGNGAGDSCGGAASILDLPLRPEHIPSWCRSYENHALPPGRCRLPMGAAVAVAVAVGAGAARRLSREQRATTLLARGVSGLARIVRQVQAKGSERGMHYIPGFPGSGGYYPGPAVVVIEPERSAVGHRLLDGRDDLRKQVVVGKIDLFCAFPSRPGDPPIRCRCHTGTVSRIGELEDSQLGLWLPLGSTLGGSPDLRITRVSPCVARGFESRPRHRPSLVFPGPGEERERTSLPVLPGCMLYGRPPVSRESSPSWPLSPNQ